MKISVSTTPRNAIRFSDVDDEKALLQATPHAIRTRFARIEHIPQGAGRAEYGQRNGTGRPLSRTYAGSREEEGDRNRRPRLSAEAVLSRRQSLTTRMADAQIGEPNADILIPLQAPQ